MVTSPNIKMLSQRFFELFCMVCYLACHNIFSAEDISGYVVSDIQ